MRKSIFKVLVLFAGSIGAASCAFFIQVLLARELEPAVYGSFATVLATVTLLAPLACVGVPGFLIRVFGVEGLYGLRWVITSLKLVTFGVVTVLLVLVLWAWLGPHDSLHFRLLCWMMPIIIGQVFMELVTVKLQLEERFYILALWQILPSLLRLCLLALVMVFVKYEQIQNVYAGAYLLTSFLISGVGLVSIKLMLSGYFQLKGHLRSKGSLLSEAVSTHVVMRYSLPYALMGVMYVIYFQSDIVLLNYLRSNEEAGLYNVAFTVMVAVYLLPNIVYQKFLLPKLYRWVNHDKKQFFKVFRVGNVVMAISGLIVMVVVFLLMPVAIPLLFGEAYRNVIPILNILVFCIPVRFIASSVVSVLVTEDNIKRKVKCMAAVAMMNIMLNFILIPILGGEGAALTTVISEVLLLILFSLMVKKHVEFV